MPRRPKKDCVLHVHLRTLYAAIRTPTQPTQGMNQMAGTEVPQAQGLYDPAHEHDSCGFGFVVDIKGRPSHDIVVKALEVLVNLEHRGATGS